jgi:ribosomal protein L11 methylase PrmA
VLADEAPGVAHVIEHPHLDFVSYPYEWSFPGLQAAALLTLDLHLEALELGLTLSDGSAYNVQFVGPLPLFIDYLSFIRYEPGQVWLGYRQFCEQFLNPLVLAANTGVDYQPLYRGMVDGIPATTLRRLLPFRAKLGLRVALHVVLQGRLQGSVTPKQTARAQRVRLSRSALRNNIQAMRSWIATLRPPLSQRTPWQDYEHSVHYTTEERATKAHCVATVIERTAPRVVWDLGCNSGEYAELACRHGAGRVIGFESDAGALNAAYRRAVTKQLDFLPLYCDLTNPSPSLGWREGERRGMAARRNADLVLCLAVLHHLVLGRGIPLAQVLEWLCALAPRGIVEFVPKEDPMARQLLALRPDPAPDYTPAGVTAALGQLARIEHQETVTKSGRTLLVYARS